MREILFRGKRLDNGEWVYGNLLRFPNGYCLIRTVSPLSYFVESHKVDPTTVGQYTGVEDKNGQKIFDGDIVDCFGMRGRIVSECGAFGIAVRDHIDYDLLESTIPFNNSAKFCFNDNFISLWELWWNYEQDDNPLFEVEVIGNIHDNPELLGLEALIDV